MVTEIKQVLRLLMLMAKQRQQRVAKTEAGGGGLLVLLWSAEKNIPQGLNCTVAAAGSWCRGIQMRQFQSAFTDLKDRVFPLAFLCPDPDPEELFAFTELYGSLRVLLSFQMRNIRHFSPECQTHIETLLKIFSLVNAGIEIYLTSKLNQETAHSEFRAKNKSKVENSGRISLILDVTSNTQAPKWVKKECWCQGGHPVLGDPLSLSIPPQVMDGGLYGELSIQPVTLLSPCMLQYPNVATQLTHIQVLVYGPSNVPVTGPSTYLKNLPAHLDYKDLGLHRLHCSSFKDLLNGGTMYEVQQENDDRESSLPTMHQSLLLLLFLQYSDPFTSEMSDVMAAEALIEHHLEDILCNNSQAVTAALQAELENALKPQNQRKREKLSTALDIIVSSSVNIVSRSSNLDFRNACLNRIKVPDTHQLSATLCETLRRVTSWKFTPRSQCYSAPIDENPQGNESTRAEM
ncbi:type 2 DNA topoisomerase 6 subunit B-like isoform X2 [Cynoglossus semilaevis]|uniref:type 2 DNA topoisomerase 6 subunit B-like isoform X2 n=1 Tax=Cynoglossus semilaevis TaxID=244447 RepID=UPI0004976D60|nr:type 2 DNA topoisomerase 6 subunit B-like isoform X2 [Cynoglossus semilaevis]